MRRFAVTGTVWTSLIASQSPCRLMDGITRLFRCVLGTLSVCRYQQHGAASHHFSGTSLRLVPHGSVRIHSPFPSFTG